MSRWQPGMSVWLETKVGRTEVRLGDVLGDGRAAEVFALDDKRYGHLLVAKLYIGRQSGDLDNLVRVISLAHERGLSTLDWPRTTSGARYAPIAVPKARIFADARSSQVVGVAVVQIEPERFRSLEEFFSSVHVRDIRCATHFGLRLAEIVAFLHAPTRSYVVGDLSETNVRVDRDGFVAILDADSFGVLDDQGELLLRPNYAPPRSLPPDVDDRGLTQASDAFMVARFVMQALFGGMDPFGGVVTDHPEVDVQARVNRGMSWLVYRDSFTLPARWRDHPGLDILPQKLHDLTLRFLKGTLHDWPTAAEWRDELRRAHDDLLTACRCGSARFRFCACPTCDGPTAATQVVIEEEPPSSVFTWEPEGLESWAERAIATARSSTPMPKPVTSFLPPPKPSPAPTKSAPPTAVEGCVGLPLLGGVGLAAWGALVWVLGAIDEGANDWLLQWWAPVLFVFVSVVALGLLVQNMTRKP